MSAVERSSALWLAQAVGHQVDGDLNRMEAERVTAKIKAYAGATCQLLLVAHEHKAHKALGYDTWADYVSAEFDISKSRSYQLISQARFILELNEAVSTIVDVSEWEVRELDPVRDEAIAAATEAVKSLPSDASDTDKAEAAADALDRVRQSLAKQTRKTTTTETTETVFDSETGEILPPEDTATSGSDQAGGMAPAAAGSGDDEQAQDTAGSEPDPEGRTPSVPPLDPVLKYRKTATHFRAQTRQGLLTLDPERVVQTSDDPKAWAEIAADLHAFADRIDKALAGPRLKAVK